jgi:predicted nicotinamide N-methyase
VGTSPGDAEVILAGDISYEETMARELIDWLETASDRGVHVLIGDPGRKYLPAGLRRLAAYRVRTSREIENTEMTEASVFTLSPGD